MVFDLESWNIFTLLLEVLILIASYHGMKTLLKKAPAALHAQKYDSRRCRRSTKNTSPKLSLRSYRNGNSALPMDLASVSRQGHLNQPAHDDDVSIDFGEDAEDFNERKIVTAQQRALQQDLPVQTDRLPEQIRAKNQSMCRSLTHIPSTDSLAIEQYRMARKISPVNEDDCHFWRQSDSQAAAPDSFPSVKTSFLNCFQAKATKVESPLSCAQPPPEPSTTFPAPTIEFDFRYRQEPQYNSLESHGITFANPPAGPKLREKKFEVCRRYEKGRCRDGGRRCLFLHPRCEICHGKHHTLQHRVRDGPKEFICLPAQ